ncbi:sialin-like isoform X2 [Argiope bruennichi]|uniref:sialin-like isoform X2 n=1 Tax=Argiope bruennichi TaxID=94029 RepID=UPI0024944B8E|nr:sialin-like isoform X2 [Argiope bruennichi]
MNCDSKQTVTRSTKCYIPKRFVLTILGFFGMFCSYAMRVNLSVAIVAMVNTTYSPSSNGTIRTMECSELVHYESEKYNKYKGEQYNWDPKTQGIILGAFFYGYFITQLPGGMLAEKFGAKWVFGLGIFITAICSLLTPLAASMGVTSMIVARVLAGLSEGVTFPAINVTISKWSPKTERSRISTIIFIGLMIGNVISLPVSGMLSGSELFGGWPSAFYFFGAISCIWFLFWSFLVYETPAQHPSISKEELLYIDLNKDEKTEKKDTPWKDIFTSLPVWAVAVGHFGHVFGFNVLLTEMSTYLNGILHFDIQANGFLSALPYASQALFSWLASYIADRMRKSGKISVTNTRKICNSIGSIGPALCLLGVTVTGCRPYLTVALLCIGMAFNGFVHSGFNITHVDMCPELAGTLYGISNTIGSFSGAIGPTFTGYFLDKGETIKNWSYVFYITSAVYLITAIFYDIFASAELQSWGIKKEKKHKEDKK